MVANTLFTVKDAKVKQKFRSSRQIKRTRRMPCGRATESEHVAIDGNKNELSSDTLKEEAIERGRKLSDECC